MEENKSKNLRVSDCHTGNYEEEEVTVMDNLGERKMKTGKFICAVCRRPCKVIEMIIDSI